MYCSLCAQYNVQLYLSWFAKEANAANECSSDSCRDAHKDKGMLQAKKVKSQEQLVQWVYVAA